MRTRDIIVFAVLGILISIVAGGMVFTFNTTNVINPILAVILGVLIFITAGGIACTYGSRIITKRRGINVTR
jgi:hypothetical protein